jgi:cytochrome c oxidase cbb3-type subunit 3
MENETIFWALIITGAVLLISIVAIGNAIKIFVKSDLFKQKLDRFNQYQQEEKKAKKVLKAVIGVIAIGGLSTTGFAQEAVAQSVETISPSQSNFYTNQAVYIVLAIDIALLAFLVYYRNLFNKLYRIDQREEEIVQVEAKVKQSTDKLTQILTDTVAVEDEESILMDHEYDGIQELDNNLPPWWKWGFVLTIVVGVIYIFNYHIFKASPLQDEEYQIAMATAQAEVDAYLKDQALNVDENTVIALVESSDIGAGLNLFNQYCTVCHLEGGAGEVGPNLTDKYWIHGGDIASIFKTIKYGAQNGMKSWKDELNPVQMQQVSSYILTLQGSNPANGKAPEGELFVAAGANESEGADSLLVATGDTIALDLNEL